MRIAVVLVAGFAMAACQPAAEEAPAAPASPAETPVIKAAPSPEVLLAIPVEYQGKWDATQEECAQASIYTVTISPNELRFHESIGEIKTVMPDGDGIVVAGPFEGEGEAWEGSMRLALSADRNTLTLTNNGEPTTRVRCA